MVQEGTFDPYYKWLGIPPEEQPPNHYRLLAVRLYETDIEVIESAADQRMSYVQQLATGPYSDLSQTLLNELAKARVCLLNANSKSEYDISLRKLLAKVRKRAQKKQQEREADEFEELEPVLPEPTGQRRRPGSRKQGQRRRSNWKQLPWMVIGVAAVAVGFASWGTYRLLNSDGSAVTVAKDDTTTLVPEVAAGTGTSSKEAKGEKAAPSPTKKDMGATEPSAKPGRPPLAIAPFDTAKAKQHQQAWADQLGTPVETTNSIGMNLKLIPPGEFQMGRSESAEALAKRFKTQAKWFEGGYPQHRVKITKPYYLGVHEVTQDEFEKVMGTSPWKSKRYVKKGWDCAATYISWDHAVEFCRKLSNHEGVEYRLPTEAEWEYACRAGSETVYSFGADSSNLGTYAWYGGIFGDGNCKNEKYAHRVGQKRASAFGLYDMHGNVQEWCADWYDENYYADSPGDDPTGPTTGVDRVARGGGWSVYAWRSQSAVRGRHTPGRRYDLLGFRVALVPSFP